MKENMKELTGSATTKDWVEATKDMKIIAYFPMPTETQPFTKRDFEGALRNVSRKVKKN